MQWIDSSVLTGDLTFNCIRNSDIVSLFLSAVACIVAGLVVIEYSNKLRCPKSIVGLILLIWSNDELKIYFYIKVASLLSFFLPVSVGQLPVRRTTRDWIKLTDTVKNHLIKRSGAGLGSNLWVGNNLIFHELVGIKLIRPEILLNKNNGAYIDLPFTYLHKL